MLFIMYPTGSNRPLDHRPLLTLIIPALFIYRSVLSLFFPYVNIRLFSYLPLRSPDSETVTVVIQSLFTPVLLTNGAGEHLLLTLLAIPAAALYWVIVGPLVEDRLGRVWFAALFLAGGASGIILTMFPGVSYSEAFWLGHTATLFCMGYTYYGIGLEDVRVKVVYWVPLITQGMGQWATPAFLLMAPIHLLLLASQTTLWYSGDNRYSVGFQSGAFTPLAWQLTISMAGFAVGALVTTLKGKQEGKAGESGKQAAWGA